jgi:hypothetical protein
MQTLAESLARVAVAREAVEGDAGWADRLRRLGAALTQSEGTSPVAAAERRLAAALDAEVRNSTTRLLALHGLQGQAQGEILARVQAQFTHHERVPEGRAALVGGAVSGALAGLKADIATGGLTLGGGLLAGALLGALGAAGLARGINLVRGTGRSWVAWSDDALDAALHAALLRYLAVAHFGRGRGDWAQGEAPPHWQATVLEALAPQRAAVAALWQLRATRLDEAPDIARLAQQLQPLLEQAARTALQRLYPAAAAADGAR